MSKAHSAHRWLLDALGTDATLGPRFVALSTNAPTVAPFGIDTANMFGFGEGLQEALSSGSMARGTSASGNASGH